MKFLKTAAVLSAASCVALAAAFAQAPYPQDGQPTEIPQAIAPAEGPAMHPGYVPDARSIASDAEVGEARRAYRNACNSIESAEFCDCVTAGVAQALMPAEVRIAARTIGERLTAQGDASASAASDEVRQGASSAERIAEIEGHYADACSMYRRS